MSGLASSLGISTIEELAASMGLAVDRGTRSIPTGGQHT
jgi:hypothetical protein